MNGPGEVKSIAQMMVELGWVFMSKRVLDGNGGWNHSTADFFLSATVFRPSLKTYALFLPNELWTSVNVFACWLIVRVTNQNSQSGLISGSPI